MIKNSHQYSTTKSPVIHQLLQEASEKPQEATRSLKKPQEATRSHKKPQEASRSHKKPQEASRSLQCPATRTLLCLSAMILMLSTAS